jgi:hypothetical protein
MSSGIRQKGRPADGDKSSMAGFAIFLMTTNAIFMGYAPPRINARWIRSEPHGGSSPVIKWLAAAAAVTVALPLALLLLVTTNLNRSAFLRPGY